MDKIAILITTFLRDNLLYKTLQSIVDNYSDNLIILIADQGYHSQEKDTTIEYYKSQIPLEYYQLPFDCGLSFARNFLVQKVSEMNIPYCLISADSIQFINKYNFQSIIDFLESNSSYGLVGFDLEESKCPWEFYM
jgi:glycosyltransferase involved in cell wall biosynthesis